MGTRRCVGMIARRGAYFCMRRILRRRGVRRSGKSGDRFRKGSPRLDGSVLRLKAHAGPLLRLSGQSARWLRFPQRSRGARFSLPTFLDCRNRAHFRTNHDMPRRLERRRLLGNRFDGSLRLPRRCDRNRLRHNFRGLPARRLVRDRLRLRKSRQRLTDRRMRAEGILRIGPQRRHRRRRSDALLVHHAQTAGRGIARDTGARQRLKERRNARPHRRPGSGDSESEMGEITGHALLRNQVEVDMPAKRRERENLLLAPAIRRSQLMNLAQEARGPGLQLRPEK